MATPVEWSVFANQGRWKAYPHLARLGWDLKRLASASHPEFRRLMIVIPPRHGKSFLASRNFPTWYLKYNPGHWVIMAGYGDQLTRRWGRAVRNQLDEYSWMDGIRSDPKHRAADNWGILGHEGGMMAVGTGGGVTGYGANCVAEGTLIATDCGMIPIQHLQHFPLSCKILCYGQGRLRYQKAQAFRRTTASRLLRITTARGRVLEVTPEHRIFDGSRYVAASDVSPGSFVVLLLPQRVHSSSIPSDQGTQARQRGQLLLGTLQQEPSRFKESAKVPSVRDGNAEEDAEVLRRMPPETARQASHASGKNDTLPDVQYSFPRYLARTQRRQVGGVLQPTMCQSGAFSSDVGCWQPDVEARHDPITPRLALGEGFSTYEATDTQSRQLRLCGLRSRPNEDRSSPHRRKPDEQRSVQSCNALQSLSRPLAFGQEFQAVADTVALVETIRQPTAVYDIQVDQDHNFFANGILVHNCMIIDDPIKGHEAASSVTQRDKLWEWWATDARSRLEPDASIVLIQTRWNSDDFAGRILKEMEVGGEHWHVHHMAALSDEHGKPLICTESNVGEGVALCPERYSVDDLWKIRKEIGAYHFNCLYQGCPTHAPGQFWDPVLFNESIWVDAIPATQTRYCVIANDPSLGKDQKRADYNAVVALSTSDADLIYVDCEMERCGAYGSIEMMSRLIDRLPQKPHVIAVESVAFQSVLCDILRPALQRNRIFCPVVAWDNENVNKDVRIQSLDSLICNRKLRFVRSRGNRLLIQQFRNYGDKQEHDDGPDAVEMGIQVLADLMEECLIHTYAA